MAQYPIAFDLDTAGMRGAGFRQADTTRVYQREIPDALAAAGFTVHAQGSLYHTNVDQAAAIPALMKLQGTLKADAPNFCRYVRRVQVFRMEECSDVTPLIADRPAAGAPDAEEEIAEQEANTAAEVME